MMEGSLQKQLDETEILEEMPFTEWLKMFSANHSAVIGLVILIFVISLSLIGPLFYKTDPFEMVWAPFSPPGEEGFLLGTDYLGRDLLAQIIHGGRASLIVGCAAALLSALIGITLGALAGFYRGWVEEVLMRLQNFSSSSNLAFFYGTGALFGASLPMITFSIGVVSWTLWPG